MSRAICCDLEEFIMEMRYLFKNSDTNNLAKNNLDDQGMNRSTYSASQ